MTSEIGSGSDAGSPCVPLSPVDEVPKPPEARQSVLYIVPKSPNAKQNTMYRHLKSPLHPRPKSPSSIYLNECQRITFHTLPVQLHWSSNLLLVYQGEDLDQSSQLTKFVSKKQEEVISRGFSQLSLATLYELFKSQLAGWEAACQLLVTTTWELKASERYTTFLNGLQHENRNSLISSDEELKCIRNVFSDQSQQDLDNDINYLQAVYDDDCEILRAIAAQADVLKRHLGSRIKDDVLLGTMGESSHTPQFIGKAPGTDDSMYDDGDSGDDDDQDSD
ncbi:hypothetical protein EDB19DRAFT_1907860 [Suillus lakei]|nr:hypothetical protein EDB19DRAFT_1907860 [Suillus lakei]